MFLSLLATAAKIAVTAGTTLVAIQPMVEKLRD